MRFISGTIVILTVALTLWSATRYVATKPKMIETQAELNHLQETGQSLSQRDIDLHLSRIR